MINAKQELLEIIESIGDNCTIMCAIVTPIFYSMKERDKPPFKKQLLKVGSKPMEILGFLDTLDFEYENQYGSQTISGTIWLNDSTWLERRCEETGLEYWEHIKKPEIPIELLSNFQHDFGKRGEIN